MGCNGSRERGPPEPTAKWEFITLSDFKSTSSWAPLAYAWLWLMAFVAVAVYAVDTFTAINLLAFDRWSSQVQPDIPFKYSRWIFAGCILLSWVLCFYEWFRAIRNIRRGGVADSYMDPLAASLQSMRGQGWRRFLVFTELTKSRKGTDYVAFFVYFAFNGAVRVILAEGPRQVVNALTLYAVMQAKLLDQGTPADHQSGVSQFFSNVKALADENYRQAVILSSMLFTLVIWVFSALCLLAAAILYLVFLWHYIPQSDGRLQIYCRRKVDRRLEKIVEHKVKAAIEEENRRMEKAEKKAELKRQKTGELPPPQPPKITRQPTLPQLGESSESKQKEDQLPFNPLARQDTSTTVSTLPVYSGRPPTRQGLQRQPTLPDMAMGGERPPMPSRSATQASGWSHASYESDAPLLPNAGYAGDDGRVASPAPTYYSRQNSDASWGRPIPGRTGTQSTQASQRSYTLMSRMDTNGSQRAFTPMPRNQSFRPRPPPGQRFPIRSNTGFSFEQEPYSAISPVPPEDAYRTPIGAPMRQDTYPPSQMGPDSQTSYYTRPAFTTPGSVMERRPTYGSLHSHSSSFSRPGPVPRKPSQASSFHRPYVPTPQQDQPTPQPNSYEMTSQPSYSSLNQQQSSSANSYVAFNPSMHSQSNTPAPQQGPIRNITVAGHPGAGSNYFGHVQEAPQRSATAPVNHRATTGYADIFDEYGDSARNSAAEADRMSPPAAPQRSYTAGPKPLSGDGWANRF